MTDLKLTKLEKKIKKAYSRATREMKKKVRDTFRDYEEMCERWQERIDSGKASEEEFAEWRKKRAYTNEVNAEMIKVLSEDTYHSNEIAANMIREHMFDIYSLNVNRTAYNIDAYIGFYTNFTLYSKATVERLIEENPELLPKMKVDKKKDLRWNKAKIRNELTQGILQGESVQKIADRFERVVGMNRNVAIRNARTATTSAQNGGRMASYERAQSIGVECKKMWLAAMDNKTRHSHRLLDGQVQDLDKPFKSILGKIMMPGDPNADDPADIYNCRCKIIAPTKYTTFDPKDLSTRFYRLPKGTTYEQWKNMQVVENE